MAGMPTQQALLIQLKKQIKALQRKEERSRMQLRAALKKIRSKGMALAMAAAQLEQKHLSDVSKGLIKDAKKLK